MFLHRVFYFYSLTLNFKFMSIYNSTQVEVLFISLDNIPEQDIERDIITKSVEITKTKGATQFLFKGTLAESFLLASQVGKYYGACLILKTIKTL